MNIKLENVLNDINGKPVGVTAIIDGVRTPRLELKQLLQYVRQGAVCDNFIITSKGIKGKDCHIPRYEFLSYSELFKKYPGKYIIIVDGIYKCGDKLCNNVMGTFMGGVVLKVMDEADYNNCDIRYHNAPYSIECTISPIDTIVGKVKR